MKTNVTSNSIVNINCNYASSPCYYQTWYIYGSVIMTCYTSYDCYYVNFYVYNGGHLTLVNAVSGYYYGSNIYLYDGSTQSIDYYSV